VPRRYVRPADLEGAAAKFLRQHHPTLDLPIPIEEIVEFELGLNIVPLPNLYRDFQIESWLSHDTQTIYVDLRQCEEMETRYRFSLAHEVSHLLLHADLFRGSRLDSFADWIAFQEGLDPVLRDNLEWQARSLAGRILVPGGPLVAHAQAMVDRARRRLPHQVSPQALYGSISIPLAALFKVHEEVVRIRLSGDGLGERLRLEC